MKTIHLGEGLALPLDIITMRSLVLGVSGSGKSTFGRLLAEKIHEAGQRFCVIDLKNDWWGLKSSADGKHAAIPVVIVGGPRADIPLDENAGAAVADIVAETPHSFVIDLDELSKGRGIRFLGAFLERLYDVNREPLLLICDEADRYAPQKPMSVEANVTLGAADDIARRGRKRGIGSLWLSQRPAVIAKNVTSQCELVVTFRTTSSLDLKELKDHIGRVASSEQVTETMRQVAGLRDGQAILMSQHPHLRIFRTAQFPMPATFDSSATPRVGARRVEPKELAAPDLEALGGRIQAAVAKAKAEDPKHLQARVRELEVQLKKAETRAPAVERVEVATNGLEAPDFDQLAGFSRTLDEVATKLSQLNVSMEAKLKAIPRLLPEGTAQWRARIGLPAQPHRKAIARTLPRPPHAVAHQSNGELNRGERAILTAIAQGGDGATREQLSVMTGYKRSSRDTYLQRLGAAGLISWAGECAHPTSEGMEALGPDFEPLPTGQDLIDHWLARLPEGERKLFKIIVGRPGSVVSRELLSEHTGYKRSSRDTYLQKLAARRLIERVGSEGVRASEDLFE